MRFVECMVLDEVKPLYLKVNEVLTRYEMDGRNASNVVDDFYDVVTQAFNNPEYKPMSHVLPDSHEEFKESIALLIPTVKQLVDAIPFITVLKIFIAITILTLESIQSKSTMQ